MTPRSVLIGAEAIDNQHRSSHFTTGLRVSSSSPTYSPGLRISDVISTSVSGRDKVRHRGTTGPHRPPRAGWQQVAVSRTGTVRGRGDRRGCLEVAESQCAGGETR